MLSYIVLLVSILSFNAFASNFNKKCSKQLASIFYDPETYANEYLQRVAADFKKGSALLFTASADSYIAAFEQEWGVNVTIADPFSACTDSSVSKNCFSVSTTVQDGSFPGTVSPLWNVAEDIVIGSVTVSVSGTSASANSDLGEYTLYKNTFPGATIQLTTTAVCATSGEIGSFSFTFADGGASELTCPAQQNINKVINPTQPLSTVAGLPSTGYWSLQITSASTLNNVVVTATYCTAAPPSTTACPRDVVRAMTNFPGFRYDSVTQTAYLTEDIFDSEGNFKQVTISRPMAGLLI